MNASNRLCIKDGKVVNIIFSDDDFVAKLMQTNQFDQIINQNSVPGFVDIGYSYDGRNATPAKADSLDPQLVVQIKIQKAILGFNNIMIQYVANNVLLGITQKGKTQLIADTLADTQRYGQSGSLYAAITALQEIVLTPEMDPFLNQTIINNLIEQAQQVLASL